MRLGLNLIYLMLQRFLNQPPYIADLKPGGNYVAKDLYEVGGVPVLLKALLDGGYLNENCITVTGKTVKENLSNIEFPKDQKVVKSTDAYN